MILALAIAAWAEPIEAEGVRITSQGVPLEIQAPRSTWDLDTREAVLEGGVTVVYGEFTMTSDDVVVRHDADGRVERVVATGDVTVVRAPYTARGAQAELFPGQARVVLTGSPSVQDDKSTLVGQEIELLLEARQVRCATCTLRLAVE